MSDTQSINTALTQGNVVEATVTRGHPHGAFVTFEGTEKPVFVRGAAGTKGDTVTVTVYRSADGTQVDVVAGPVANSAEDNGAEVADGLAVLAARTAAAVEAPESTDPGAVSMEALEQLAANWGATLKVDNRERKVTVQPKRRPETVATAKPAAVVSGKTALGAKADQAPTGQAGVVTADSAASEAALVEQPVAVESAALPVEPAVVCSDNASEPAVSEVGMWITGKVTNLLAKPVNGNPKERKPYGVLVELPEGGKGLLHVTELPGNREEREEALAALTVGSEVTAAVKEIEEDPEGKTRKVKLSRKLLVQQQKVAAYKDGDVVYGTVKRVETYGALVQLEGVNGLLHVSQVPGSNLAARQAYLEALVVGDAVTATVIEVDLAEARIGLSVRPQVRAQFMSEEHEGEEFEGAVVSVKDYGVLVNIGAVVGLVHVSQLPGKTREDRDSYLAGIRERFEARRNRSGKPSTPPEVLTVKVESIDRDKDRVALSMR